MTSQPQLEGPPRPDVDLLEYVLLSAPSLPSLGEVATAVAELDASGAIRVIDAVVLLRPSDGVDVSIHVAEDREELAALAGLADRQILLSHHDLELASATLDPGEAALLLLVEDRWAGRLSAAARAVGGQLAGGERIARDRVEASLGGGGADLLARSPLGSTSAGDQVPVLDQVAQVRELSRLVERGLLSLDRYDVQRRRVLGG